MCFGFKSHLLLPFLFGFFLTLEVKSQGVLKGSIIDLSTNIGVPFATVGLTKANKGTNTDEYGNFIITNSIYSNDTLLISCVGYENYKIAVNSLSHPITIKLKEKTSKLEEVIIYTNLKSSKWLDNYSTCGNNWFTSSGTTALIAKHFHSPFSKALLTEIKLCKMSGKSLFRIRVFDFDTILLKPSLDLIDTIIEVKTRDKHVSINLKEYNIIIPQKDFFVAIEWLCIPYNENKMKIKTGGRQVAITQFSPELAIRYSKDRTGDDNNIPQTWQYDYRGKWNPAGLNMQIVMSVKLEY